MPRYSEFGKQCQSCFKRGEAQFSRIYFRKCKGFSGKQKEEKILRRLCRDCWDKANEGKL